MMFFGKWFNNKPNSIRDNPNPAPKSPPPISQLLPLKDKAVENKLDTLHSDTTEDEEYPIDPVLKAEYDAISDALDWAKPYHLEVEVFHHAMSSLKRDPSQSIEEVLSAAAWSWDL